MSVIKQFVIQRYVHKSFGLRDCRWSDYSWDGDIAKTKHDLMDNFKQNRDNEDLAMKVLNAVSVVRKGQKFRIIERITTVEETPLMEIGPRKVFTLDDLRKLAEKPIAHDGVRDTNENVPAIKEAGLDPSHFGALPSALVLFALDHIEDQPDEWILVHSESYSPHVGYKSWDHKRTWWNLAQKAYIVFETWGVADDPEAYFTRHDYGDDTADKAYRTFKAAASQNKKQTCKGGCNVLSKAMKTFPKDVREL